MVSSLSSTEVGLPSNTPLGKGGREGRSGEILLYRFKRWALSPKPFRLAVGVGLLVGFWWLAVEILELPRFRNMPGVTTTWNEWTSREPVYGVSLFTEHYYHHIYWSVRRVAIAFLCALGIGIPLGLAFGWWSKFRQFTFPIFEVFRPIPILAWVPLAILMFQTVEAPVIFLTFLPAFFATTLNTYLGVQSIDRDLVRAAKCLGSDSKAIFRHVVIPGSLPYIFIGLQIAIGVGWFSLVAGEMIAGRFGLGYLINESYMNVRYVTIIIGMITLGFCGWMSSVLIRLVANFLMQYRARALGQE